MGQAIGYTVPAPSLGLNLVDPIDDMDPRYALELSNIVAAGFSSFLRNGYTLYGQIGSGTSTIWRLQGVNNADGTNQLLVHAAGGIWRQTLNTSTAIGSGYSNTPFNSDTFGYRAYFANGVDPLQVVFTGAAATSDFTGVSLSNLIAVSSYKERLYFIEKNTLKVWYGNAQAVGASALNSFDFAFGMKDGGYLVSCGSYTNNTADTSRDLFYALSSEGEILFYNGSSPADATTPWGLVARYKIGRPVGFRAAVKVGNDTWIITDQGLISIAALFSADPIAALKGVGDKINPFIVQQAALFPFSWMWSGTLWQKGRRVYLTVPLSGTASTTLVYHMDGGWTTYSLGEDQAALNMTVSGNVLYYGAFNGKIYVGESGQSDNLIAIPCNGRLPFNFFGSRGNFKAFKDVRPLMRTARNLNLQLGIDTDFRRTLDLSSIATSSGTFTPWGSPWGSPWSSGVEYVYDRHTLNGQGHSGALRFKGSLLNAPLELYGFEIGFEPGSRV